MNDFAVTAIIVDDNPDHCFLARRTLAANAPNLRVEAARDGQEGLDLLRKLLGSLAPHGRWQATAARCVFVLLDLDMPRWDGFAFLEALRRDPALAPVPVLLLSSCMQEEPIRRAYQLGALGYVGKPLNHPPNLRTLQNYLDLLQIPISLLAAERHQLAAPHEYA